MHVGARATFRNCPKARRLLKLRCAQFTRLACLPTCTRCLSPALRISEVCRNSTVFTEGRRNEAGAGIPVAACTVQARGCTRTQVAAGRICLYVYEGGTLRLGGRARGPNYSDYPAAPLLGDPAERCARCNKCTAYTATRSRASTAGVVSVLLLFRGVCVCLRSELPSWAVYYEVDSDCTCESLRWLVPRQAPPLQMSISSRVVLLGRI